MAGNISHAQDNDIRAKKSIRNRTNQSDRIVFELGDKNKRKDCGNKLISPPGEAESI